MPGFDGTGPMGQGAMTGGGRGYCVSASNGRGAAPILKDGFYGRGRGFFCRGGGRGLRNWYYATGFTGRMRAQREMQAFGGFGRVVSKEDELETLKSQADFLKQQLEEAQARIQAAARQQEFDKK